MQNKAIVMNNEFVPDYVWIVLGGYFSGIASVLGIGWFKAIGMRVTQLEGVIKALEKQTQEQEIKISNQQECIVKHRERITKLRSRLHNAGIDHEDSEVIDDES